MSVIVMNYLEVMVDNEEVLKNQLDKICGITKTYFHILEFKGIRFLWIL
jgi:hypothetical protein